MNLNKRINPGIFKLKESPTTTELDHLFILLYQEMQIQQMQIKMREIKMRMHIQQEFLLKCLLKVAEKERIELLNNSVSKKKYKMHTPIRKYFPGYGWYDGKIIGYKKKEYFVIYTDGDKESYYESDLELEKIVIEASNHKMKTKCASKRKRKRCI